MEINIQAIADEKIKVMHESGQVKETIEQAIEKTVLNAINQAINGYQISRNIEEQVTESVSGIVKDIGFSAYNGFIAEKVKSITENVMRDDIAQKIQKTFDDLLIAKHENVKLSEIFNKYREWVCECTEESDKYERERFTCELEEKESGNFTHYVIKFHDEELDTYEKAQIEFRMCTYNCPDKQDKTTISSLCLDGVSTKDKFKLGTLTKVEALLANLYYNNTDIILDVENVDDDNYFDIDI